MSKTAPNTITKIVKIQDLEPVTTNYRSSVDKNEALAKWKRVKCNHWKDCTCNVLTYLENMECNTYSHPNSFYGAFVNAYNNHEDVVLSPDDVWMIVCLQFSKYVNNNAEQMRDLFVSHQGQKKLTVTTWNETSEGQWDEFFTLMIDAIRNNTKGEIVDVLKANFTTTGRIENLLSIATVMNSFQKYFSYGRCIPCCGIKAVRFMGQLSDWISLMERITLLEKYAVTKEWSNYIQNIVPILRQFINTYNENVDVDFWNRVMNITYGRLGSGSTTYVSGWILNFFGLSGKVESDDIKNDSIEFPVEIDNKLTGEQKTVNVIGGFGGVNKTDGAYRPQMSMIVFHSKNV